MKSTTSAISIESMPNGFIRVYDYGCQWAAIYNADGSYRHSGTNAYMPLVRSFLLAQPRPVTQ